MTDWTSLRYAVVDVEGNGQQPPDLVEVAAVPIVGGVVGEPSSWLVKPARPITPIVRRIHGLSNQDVADAPSFAEVEDGVRRVLDVDVLVAHNAHVDVGVLQRHLGEWTCPDVLDTLKLAKRLRPNQSSYKLGALVEAFGLAAGLPDGLSPHRATYDVLVTARLFVQLATRTDNRPRSIEELRGDPPGGDEDEPPTLF
ncbi:3'-5' exonuclease [Actinophytocola oryzae]|uniref:Exodeoxyribonuclease X n=1 Tax=Actinophytocola oryzae TaxID=502181 RepID=A0A4R7V7L2_9PSEU|nr:3'-5' exonuclease [Actinophytocola oryzae]TDV43696.1 exodeoxyribonuclease X [Actinophytocola oryzae]